MRRPPAGDMREPVRMPPHDPRYPFDPRRGGPRGGAPPMRDEERDRGHGGPLPREGKDPRESRPERPHDTPDEYRPQRGAIRGRGRGRGRGAMMNEPPGDRMKDDHENDHRGEANIRRRQRGGDPDNQRD